MPSKGFTHNGCWGGLTQRVKHIHNDFGEIITTRNDFGEKLN